MEKSEKKILGTLQSGEKVIDRKKSHLDQHVDVKPLLIEAFSKINTENKNFTMQEVDMGRIIGNSLCVETNGKDRVFFAQRPNRNGLTRFVENREPNPSSMVAIILQKSSKPDEYILITAFIGRLAPPEPWDKRATEASIDFWNTHALIEHPEFNTYIPGTKTDIYPW